MSLVYKYTMGAIKKDFKLTLQLEVNLHQAFPTLHAGLPTVSARVCLCQLTTFTRRWISLKTVKYVVDWLISPKLHT